MIEQHGDRQKCANYSHLVSLSNLDTLAHTQPSFQPPARAAFLCLIKENSMPRLIHDLIRKASSLGASLVLPARRVVAFIAANPKTALALWGASFYLAWRF